MRKMYQQNKDLREYVDRYCRTYELTVDEALDHALVREVAESYLNKNNDSSLAPEVNSTYTPIGECV